MKNKLLLISISLLSVIIMFFIIYKGTFSLDDNILGDVNNDGLVNKDDAIAIAKYIIDGTNITNYNAADVNNDGKVKMNDVVLIALDKLNNEILPEEVSLDITTENIMSGEEITINSTILPEDATNKNITWISSNDNVATVDEFGKVTTKKPGVVNITALTDNGKAAIASLIVNKYNVYDSYEGDTLKYYIEKPNNNYIVTRIWAKNAYNQMRVAITKPMEREYAAGFTPTKRSDKCYLDENRDYVLYDVMQAGPLLNNEIANKGYANKAMVAINASGMSSDRFYTNAPCDWFGTAAIPLVINDGNIIRDSTAEYNYGNRVYGLTRNGDLKYYPFYNEQSQNNIRLGQTVINDGVKYTFGFLEILVSNYNAVATKTDKNIRQAICQIDRNNFILISSSLSSYADSVVTTNGLSFKYMGEEMASYGCKSGYNLDGGASEIYYYKKNNPELKRIGSSYDGRGLADMLYFVEE